MHTQHAAPGGPHHKRDPTLAWFARAYTLEAKPDYTLPPGSPPAKPFPRALGGNLWLDVLKKMVEDMPTPLVPADVIGSAGGDGLPMQELRNELMVSTAEMAVKDSVWRYVVTQVREIRHDWTYFAIGLALPGLWKAAMYLAPPKLKVPFDKVASIHRKMATGFVDALGKVDLKRDRVAGRLIEQATYSAQGFTKARQIRQVDVMLLNFVNPFTRPASFHQHTSSYLDALIALGQLVDESARNKPGRRLTLTDAQLIAYTYIDGHTLAQAAPWVGLPEPAARMRRDRARKLIANLLNADMNGRFIRQEKEVD